MSSELNPTPVPEGAGSAPATGSIRRPKTTGLTTGPVGPGVAKVDPILTVDAVQRRFGGLTAVDVDHLEIPRGAITALIGPNGAGKTTLFNLLCGFDKPNTGTWSFDGTSLSGVPSFKVARMGQVRTFQLTKSLSLLTVLENMKLGAPHQRGEKFWSSLFPFLWRAQDQQIEAKARGLLTRFKLDAKEKDFAAALSGGQRKLLEHIVDLKEQGMTVLFVEHDMHMVRHIADWVVVMAEGRVVAEGPPEEVMEDPAVVDAYLGAHQDVDLGAVTGRIAVQDAEAVQLREKIEAEVEAEAEAHEEGTA